MMRCSRKNRLVRSRRNRDGLTILEVILAIGVFLASATIITQLLATGTRAAVEGRLKSQLALLAESKMAEAASGVIELVSASSQSFDDDVEVDPEFTWTLDIEPGSDGDLLTVTVLTEHTNAQDNVDMNFSITRLMRDPQIWIDAAAEAEEE